MLCCNVARVYGIYDIFSNILFGGRENGKVRETGRGMIDDVAVSEGVERKIQETRAKSLSQTRMSFRNFTVDTIIIISSSGFVQF